MMPGVQSAGMYAAVYSAENELLQFAVVRSESEYVNTRLESSADDAVVKAFFWKDHLQAQMVDSCWPRHFVSRLFAYLLLLYGTSGLRPGTSWGQRFQ